MNLDGIQEVVMQKWEYLVRRLGRRKATEKKGLLVGEQIVDVEATLHAGGKYRPLNEALDILGGQGWELAGTHSYHNILIFKRPKED
jgi:hypothetical protein